MSLVNTLTIMPMSGLLSYTKIKILIVSTLLNFMTKTQLEKLTNGCIFLSQRNVTLELLTITPVYLTAIAAKMHSVLLFYPIRRKVKKFLKKNQNGFRRNWSQTSEIPTIRRFLKRICIKNLQARLSVVFFSKAFDSIPRVKLEQVLCFDLFTRPKMPFKVVHRKEVTHSDGSYERKSRGRKLADEMGRGKKKNPIILS